MKIKITLLMVMIVLSTIYGLINHLIIMPIFKNQLIHCLILSLAFGFVYYYIALKFLEENKNLKQSNSILESTAALDGLTKLLNRKAFEDDIQRLNECENYAVIFIDIDDFKIINDLYGHKYGDEVLKKVSKLIVESIRVRDRVYRYGGDEIVVIIKNCDLVTANIIAEKIRKRVKTIDVDMKIGITLSLGVASCSDGNQTIREIINNADQALLNAKLEGKDCTKLYQHLI